MLKSFNDVEQPFFLQQPFCINIVNISYKDQMSNKELYSDIPPVISKIQQRRMRHAGHCMRHPEEIANKLRLWEPWMEREIGDHIRLLMWTTY